MTNVDQTSFTTILGSGKSSWVDFDIEYLYTNMVVKR
jgi:hypothetical protein